MDFWLNPFHAGYQFSSIWYVWKYLPK